MIGVIDPAQEYKFVERAAAAFEPAGSRSSNRTGLCWMTIARECIRPPLTRSPILTLTMLHPRSLLSFARSNIPRSRSRRSRSSPESDNPDLLRLQSVFGAKLSGGVPRLRLSKFGGRDQIQNVPLPFSSAPILVSWPPMAWEQSDTPPGSTPKVCWPRPSCRLWRDARCCTGQLSHMSRSPGRHSSREGGKARSRPVKSNTARRPSIGHRIGSGNASHAAWALANSVAAARSARR
jgi:hypothetical protein